jgi:hypothetical protein
MRKLKYLVIFFIINMFFITCSYAVDVRVNFIQINLPTEAIIQNNRTLVPLRVLAEIFGANVHWEESGKINVYHEQNVMQLNVNSEYINVNGKIEKVDEFNLPESDIGRTVITIRKERQTPSKYPRKPGTPSKEPIK